MTQPQELIEDVEFCLQNPDVLHTPAQHREMIQGLLQIVKMQLLMGMTITDLKLTVPEPVPHHHV